MLPGDFCQAVASRLSSLPDLALPAYMSRDRLPPDAAEITNHISELLQRDPAVFLERYGSQLQPQEISAFDPLRGSNYEIDYWLRHVQQQHEQLEVSSSGRGNSQQLSTTVKNRRLAYMQRLQKQGDYFTEDSMRGREPLIWHEYIGQHEGHPLPSAAAPTGEGLAGAWVCGCSLGGEGVWAGRHLHRAAAQVHLMRKASNTQALMLG